MELLFDALKTLQMELSEEYINNAYVLAGICGLVFFAFFLFTAIKYKKARGFGITTAILQLFGAIGASLYAIYFHTMEFEHIIIVEGPNKEEAQAALKDALTEVLGGYAIIFIGSLFVLLSWIFALIYIIKMKSEIMKAFVIPAMILHIIRYVIVPPICFPIGIFDGNQQEWDYFYYAACALPFILLFVGALIGKKKEAPVVAQVVDATQEEIAEVAESTETNSAEQL